MSDQSHEHPILRHAADVISTSRLIFGIIQAADLLVSQPEDMTWADAGLSAFFAATDAIDGPLARRFGGSSHGGALDRAADVSFFGLGDLALSVKGETDPVHTIIDVVRELGVNAMRYHADKNGQPPIRVGMRGRQKTFAKMTSIVLARSPLAKYNNLLESASSIGSALSILSAVDYTNKFIKGLRGESEEAKELTDTSRNGSLRASNKERSMKVAHWLNDHIPRLTPDMLTRTGELGVEGADVLAYLKPEWGLPVAASLYTVGSLLDMADGDLSRVQGTSSVQGMINDVSADKREEIFTAATNSLMAGNNGNSVAAYQYAVAAMTATWPALARAVAESRGHFVSEDAIGSRVPRAIEGGIGLGFNRHRNVNNINSAFMVAGNIITTAQRTDVILRGESSPHYRGPIKDEEIKQNAEIKRRVLANLTLDGIAVGVALIAREKIRASLAKA